MNLTVLRTSHLIIMVVVESLNRMPFLIIEVNEVNSCPRYCTSKGNYKPRNCQL